MTPKSFGLESLGGIIILEDDKFFRIDGKIKIKGNKIKIRGKKEEVEFYPGFGWATDDELFEERQRYPHSSP